MSIYFNKFVAINELKVKGPNGKDVDPEEDKDYTKEEPDDENNDPPPAEDPEGGGEHDAPEGDATDYTAENPEEGEPPVDGETNKEDDTDYTVPEDDTPEDGGEEPPTEEDNAEPEGDTIDYTADKPDDEPPAEGEVPPTDGEEPPANGEVPPTDGEGGGEHDTPEEDYTDYTADNPDDDPPAEGEAGDDPNGVSMGTQSELQDLESKIFSDLSPEQLNIKHIELKTQFIDLYNTIDKTINRINKIVKSEENLPALEFVINKLIELKNLINVNLTKTYLTKTYIENEVDYQHCLAIFNTISKILQDLSIKKK